MNIEPITEHNIESVWQLYQRTVAELEREMVAERTKDKMVAMVRQGKWPGGNLPLGYDVRDGRLAPNDKEAPLVRLIFDTFLEVRSTALVRDKMIALGVATKRPGFKRETPPNVISSWSLQKIDYILRNRVYLGELNYDGVRVPGAHEAIVDEDTFALVQGALGLKFKRPKISTPHRFFLAGCGPDGGRLPDGRPPQETPGKFEGGSPPTSGRDP